MSKVLKVYIEGGNSDYTRLAEEFGEVVWDHDDANVILFTGGADVSPALYGEQRHARTSCNPPRDAVEAALFWGAVSSQVVKPRAFIGICRGGQFLNVMNGGRLYQHVENHTRDHFVKDLASKTVHMCSSTHHQMFRPAEHAKVLAVACSDKGEIQSGTPKETYNSRYSAAKDYDFEAVWYPSTGSLCFQPHPEYPGYKDCKNLFLKYVDTYVSSYLFPSKESA